jgi:hypothetical protein
MVHKLCELLRNKYSAKEGTDVRVTSWIKFWFIIMNNKLCVIQQGLITNVIWGNYMRRITVQMWQLYMLMRKSL